MNDFGVSSAFIDKSGDGKMEGSEGKQERFGTQLLTLQRACQSPGMMSKSEFFFFCSYHPDLLFFFFLNKFIGGTLVNNIT